MTRRKSKNKKNQLAPQSQSQNQNENKNKNENENLANIRVGSLFKDNKVHNDDDIGTKELHDELVSFRQRWKRELQEQNVSESPELIHNISCLQNQQQYATTSASASCDPCNLGEAKRLFLTGVKLEQDGLYSESIRYYKQATDICPDVEKRVYRDQCQSIDNECLKKTDLVTDKLNKLNLGAYSESSFVDLVRANHASNPDHCRYPHCIPSVNVDEKNCHISCLPYEIILRIIRWIIGDELDLESLENFGSVCRGFFLATRDPSIWRTLCVQVWGESFLEESLKALVIKSDSDVNLNSNHINIDWRKFFIETPRVNFNGIYISETKYIRFGDVGFQDITYRPFHIVRYYRYLRFMPNGQVLILMTNEEPNKIKPLFRQARNLKQFSPELSVMQGTYKLHQYNLNIVAEKKYPEHVSLAGDGGVDGVRADIGGRGNRRNRRDYHNQWPTHTPLSRKFFMEFELSSGKNLKLYRNARLKWLNYSILTERIADQETDKFDLIPSEFPDLFFSKIKRVTKVSD